MKAENPAAVGGDSVVKEAHMAVTGFFVMLHHKFEDAFRGHEPNFMVKPPLHTVCAAIRAAARGAETVHMEVVHIFAGVIGRLRQ